MKGIYSSLEDDIVMVRAEELQCECARTWPGAMYLEINCLRHMWLCEQLVIIFGAVFLCTAFLVGVCVCVCMCAHACANMTME